MSTHESQPADLALTQSFEFSASHELRLLPNTHRCSRNHGHNYQVTATVTAGDNGGNDVASGFTLFDEYLRATFDHRLINDQVAIHPTSELLAQHLAGWFRDAIGEATATLISMEVAETPSSSARFDVATANTTITKTFRSRGHANVDVTVGAHELDGYGFVTDFGELAPFSRHLEHPATLTSLRAAGPTHVGQLASWFVEEVEPKIHGHLVAMRVTDARASGQWSRGGTA